MLNDTVVAASFVEHPYRNNVIGWTSDVERLSHDEIAAFYRRHYSPANAVLAIAGPSIPRTRSPGYAGSSAIFPRARRTRCRAPSSRSSRASAG